MQGKYLTMKLKYRSSRKKIVYEKRYINFQKRKDHVTPFTNLEIRQIAVAFFSNDKIKLLNDKLELCILPREKRIENR